MVKHAALPLDTIFSALADSTRRAILSRLARGPATVTEIAEPFDISLPAVSKHLRVLERAGLLIRQKKGRIHTCHLNATPLREASGWIAMYEQFWEGQLDSLAQFLEETEKDVVGKNSYTEIHEGDKEIGNRRLATAGCLERLRSIKRDQRG